MSKSCCEEKSPTLDLLAKAQSRVLWIVLAINFAMFGVEAVFAFVAGSLALLADSLDMLGDAMTYGVSLFVVNRGLEAKASAAKFKAWIILVSAVGILVAAFYRSFFQVIPSHEVMGVIGFLALAANLVCLMLLSRFRHSDVNMSSVWLCSRNDIIANVSVLIAAVLVSYFASPWPDLVVGGALSFLFFRSAMQIFAEANQSLVAKPQALVAPVAIDSCCGPVKVVASCCGPASPATGGCD